MAQAVQAASVELVVLPLVLWPALLAVTAQTAVQAVQVVMLPFPALAEQVKKPMVVLVVWVVRVALPTPAPLLQAQVARAALAVMPPLPATVLLQAARVVQVAMAVMLVPLVRPL